MYGYDKMGSDNKRQKDIREKSYEKIYGSVVENRVQRIRRNNELQQLYGKPEISDEIKLAKMRWVGNQRMTEYLKEYFKADQMEEDKK